MNNDTIVFTGLCHRVTHIGLLTGLPGYIRIESMYQGDLDKRKGVYHINAVDDEPVG